MRQTDRQTSTSLSFDIVAVAAYGSPGMDLACYLLSSNAPAASRRRDLVTVRWRPVRLFATAIQYVTFVT